MVEIIRRSFFLMKAPINLVIWPLLIVGAVIAGPFGTFDSPGLWQKLLFWTLIVLISSFFGRVIHSIAAVILPEDRPFARDAVLVVGMMVAFAPVAQFLTEVLMKDAPASDPGFWQMVFFVAGVTMAVCVVRRTIPGFEAVGY